MPPFDNRKTLFSERQRLMLWYWYLIPIFAWIDGIFARLLYVQLVQGIPAGNNPMSDTGLVIFSLLIFVFTFWFFSLRLDTVIKEDGIHLRFFRLTKPQYYPWEKIARFDIVKYKPITDYGGWGIRGERRNMVYTVSGNKGLQLYLSNGSKVLIGTRRPKEMEKALRELGKIK